MHKACTVSPQQERSYATSRSVHALKFFLRWPSPSYSCPSPLFLLLSCTMDMVYYTWVHRQTFFAAIARFSGLIHANNCLQGATVSELVAGCVRSMTLNAKNVSYLLFIYYCFLDFKPFNFFMIFQMNAASSKKHMACGRITRKSNGNTIVIFIQLSPYDENMIDHQRILTFSLDRRRWPPKTTGDEQ